MGAPGGEILEGARLTMHISIGLPRKEESGAAVDIADIARAMSLGKGWRLGRT